LKALARVDLLKCVYLDLNHWIRLSTVHIKKEGDQFEKKLYRKLLALAEEEEVIFLFSLVHLEEISRSKHDKSLRVNLAKTVIAFTKNNCIQPLTTTLDYEAKYATIKILAEELTGYKKKEAKYFLDSISKNLGEYPYHPIEKGISALGGAEPALVDQETKKRVRNNEIMEKINDYLDDPENLIELAASEQSRKIYNSVKSEDYEEMIQREEKLKKLRKNKNKKDRKRYKHFHFFLWSGIIEITYTQILYWSEKLSIDPSYALMVIYEYVDEKASIEQLTKYHKSMHSAWCWYKLEEYRDRHYERKVKVTDIMDIRAISNAIPYCDIVVCDKFYANAAKSSKLDEINKTIIIDDLSDLLDILK